ncbi:AcrR family transcriptional regulator [Crossiella equi]|uniref:AcrR family transcriptional regulator n=1 Tax=Crossiella equi TaxID=130796 RepID=A0ABS5A5N2_9PSEU|nr:TetR/AcrR family transcriptional regulator [Crossiella equi]MBP2471606.1 AcrR family transcriptional regulator [Crossiella equi]
MAVRTNQRQRTHDAIVRAATTLVCQGRELSMPEVACAALVSEATAYRYFPDLATLMSTVMGELMPTPAEALAGVADSVDPVERVAAVTGLLLRRVLRYQGLVRTTIAASATRPPARLRRRMELIDAALAPVTGLAEPALARLRLDLAVVVGPESLFTLLDLGGLTEDEAVASAVRTATTLVRAALG